MIGKKEYFKFLFVLLCGVFATSCGVESIHECAPQQEPESLVQVMIATPSEATRTEIEENGAVTRWSAGDQIALWAESGSSFALEAEPFSLWRLSEEFPTAYFTSYINPMPESDYRYYGAYPVPVSAEGLTALYDLPAEQNGSSDIGHAVMVARPVSGAALTQQDGEPLHLDFVHKCHILKISIPEGKNLLGEPLKRLDITFPTEVTGRLAVNLSDPEAEVALSGGSKTLSLRFDRPVDAGDVIFAVVAPVDASKGMITFRAYSESREAQPIATLGKKFLAGHTTPIRLTIPDMRHITRIYFSVGENYLGEAPNKITITAPAGVTFPDGASSISFDVNESNSYEYLYEGLFTDNLSGKSFTMSFDSNHALVHQSFVMPQLVKDGRTEVPAVDVPYLYYEDFSTIKGYDDNGSGRNLDSSGSTINDSFRVSGWTGNQTYGTAGKAIAVRTRRETVAEYCGRVDSPPLSGLKEGVSAKVNVSFNYGFSSEHENTELKMHFGYTTRQGGISGNDAIENRTEVVAIDRTGSTSNVNRSQTIQWSGFTNQHRLSFGLYSTYAFTVNGWGSYNHWLYLDNIVVTIAE